MKVETASEVIKATPPVTVSAAYLAGLSINDLVAGATLIYVLLQIALLIPRLIQQWREWRGHE